MILKTVEFIISAVEKNQYPKDNLPQIVLTGRSNVGKSSFINTMLQRKNIARTSQTPGKTRLINFFLINKQFYFVDIPGYGYANVSKKQIMEFKVIIERYLQNKSITLAVLLLDIRRIPNEDDLLMYNYFKELGIETLIVLTKTDKLSNNKKFNQIQKIKKTIKPRETDKLITFSSITKENREKIWAFLEEHISRYQNEEILQ
ncbi:MAG: hypothetical protein B6I17_02205 [Tenericutes bacterium 4572_104]|nr:MAG: hypothetical protein B6I17_02205 [Tenericutes bacterium 4572_104]